MPSPFLKPLSYQDPRNSFLPHVRKSVARRSRPRNSMPCLVELPSVFNTAVTSGRQSPTHQAILPQSHQAFVSLPQLQTQAAENYIEDQDETPRIHICRPSVTVINSPALPLQEAQGVKRFKRQRRKQTQFF